MPHVQVQVYESKVGGVISPPQTRDCEQDARLYAAERSSHLREAKVIIDDKVIAVYANGDERALTEDDLIIHFGIAGQRGIVHNIIVDQFGRPIQPEGVNPNDRVRRVEMRKQ